LTLEKLAREWARKFDNIYIVCGPIITENKYGTIGSNKVIVPDAFFKAFLTVKNNVFNTIAFIMPNESTHHRIQEYAVSVNDLEQIIGVDLFTNIDDRFEEMVESDVYFKYWGL
jgi:endonuclease G